MTPEQLVNQEYIRALMERGGVPHLVGGHVRDLLLKRPHKDFDLLITKLGIDDLATILKKYGAVNLVGKSFGIIKFRPHQHQRRVGGEAPAALPTEGATQAPIIEMDIALPRAEQSTGIGHRDFSVQFDPTLPVEIDLGRRDFTINAMALDLVTKRLIDPFQGQRDLERGIIRQVFAQCFKEDPLRLMRAVQFAARLQLTIDPATKVAMQEHSALIDSVAPERIMEEIRKLLTADRPSIGFDIMRDTELLRRLFPFIHKMIGIKQPKKKNEDVYTHTMRVLDASRSASELLKPGDLDLMLSALLHDAGKPFTYRVDKDTQQVTFYGHQNASAKIADRWLNHFKATVTGANPSKIKNLVQNHMFETKAFYTDRAIRRFINKIGPDQIMDLIDLRIADKKGGRYPDSMKGILNLRGRINDELAKKPPFGPKDLALNGHDIMGLGFRAGPIIGQIMAYLVDKVLDEPDLNNRETLTRLVKEQFPT